MKVQYEDGQFPHIGIPVGETSRVSTTQVSILELHYFSLRSIMMPNHIAFHQIIHLLTDIRR